MFFFFPCTWTTQLLLCLHHSMKQKRFIIVCLFLHYFVFQWWTIKRVYSWVILKYARVRATKQITIYQVFKALPSLPHLVSFAPLSLCQAVTTALLSLKMVYPRRNLPAEQWRSAQLLSLLSAPAAMLDSACCDTVSLISSHTLNSCFEIVRRGVEKYDNVLLPA